MSEDDLLRTVLDLARLYGVLVAHFRPAMLRDKDGRERWVTAVQGDGKGYPDLTLVGAGVLFRELKSERGPATAEQKKWLAALRSAGQDAGIWRPSDLRNGRITEELRAIAVKVASAKPAWMK